MNNYFDTETAPEPDEILESMKPEFSAPANYKDPEKIAANIADQEAKWKERAALSPMSGRIVAFAVAKDDGTAIAEASLDPGDEKGLLENIWDSLTQHTAYTETVLGWNILGFDLPFVLKRSWKLGVKVPRSTLSYNFGRAKFNRRFVDMMDFWTCGSQERFTRLDTALKFFGLDGKVDLGDELFYQTYARDPELAMSYLRRDVLGLVELEKHINVSASLTDIQPPVS